jgi:hypothetical protein
MAIKHEVAVELFYSGDWHDHAATEEVYTGEATHGDDIKISHGKGAWSGGITPAQATLVFRSWRFNPDNVSGDLYGLIGRNTPIRITVDGAVRFSGEVASWTPKQSLGGDVQVPDRWVEVEAGGILRRLQTGTDPLPSSLRTFYLQDPSEPLAYWPLDSGQLSLVGLPEVGGASFDISDGAAKFAGADLALWLEPGVEIGHGLDLSSMAGNVTMSKTPNRWTVDHMRRHAPDSRGLDLQVIGNTVSASAERYDWVLEIEPTTAQLRFFQLLVDDSPSSVLLDTIAPDIFDDQPHHLRLELNQDGTGIDWVISVDGVSASTGTVAASDMQGVSAVRFNSFTDASPTAAVVGHVAVWSGTPPDLDETVTAAFGYPGETAGERFFRLSDEAPVTSEVRGDDADTVPMGPQFPGKLVAQYEEIQDADDGIIADNHRAFWVTYKTGRDRYNQTPALELDYAAYEIAPPLNPVIDDKLIRNDVTVSRREGASARAVDEDNVDAVGRYTDSLDVNVFSDLVVDAAAGWQLHTGTVAGSGTRFDRLTIDLDACPHLADAVAATNIGDRATIDHLPAELTPDLANLLVIGWNETIAPDRRKIIFNCIPEAALHIAELEHADYATVGPMFTTLSGNHSASTTSLAIQMHGDGPWDHETDFDIVISGERMTVTAAGAGSGTFPNQSQTLTVVRSVNGVVKSHLNGLDVRLFYPAYIGL